MSTNTVSTNERKRKEMERHHVKTRHQEVSEPFQSNHLRNTHGKKQRSHPNNDSRSQQEKVLLWPSTEPHVPLATEEGMMPVILRWGAKERGMLKDQPFFRYREIQQQCQRLRFRISQACSLRRHHMQKLNPYKTKEALKLGDRNDINAAAQLFEQAIAKFLHKNQVTYWSEQEQKAQFRIDHPGMPLLGTPDFKLTEPVLLRVYSVDNRNHRKRFHGQPHPIHWIEAKMFYGASTIPADEKSAVGSILSKMKTYVELYGPGAIVFSQGCGDKLAKELTDIGVTPLSCFSSAFDFTDLHEQQRRWCADKKGNILP